MTYPSTAHDELSWLDDDEDLLDDLAAGQDDESDGEDTPDAPGAGGPPSPARRWLITATSSHGDICTVTANV